MQKIFVLHKPIGKTPLTLLNDFRHQFPEYASVKIGYAGRLDPMADGLVLYMVADENKNRETYLALDKQYDVELLFGVDTESYDILGLIRQSNGYDTSVIIEKLRTVLPTFEGDILQAFPPYSSKPVNGKPLYYWARKGKLAQIEIPKEKRKILRIRKTSERLLNTYELKKIIQDKLSQVEGDFNQSQIIQRWTEFLGTTHQGIWLCVKIHVLCSSGTYMRSLAHDIGKAVGVGACALSITRTHIGTIDSPTDISLLSFPKPTQ